MIELYLPFPNSTNSHWSWSRNGIYLSKKGRLYREQVAEAIHQQASGYVIASACEVSIWLHRKDRRQYDIDNYLKSLLDSIEASSLLENDRLIDALHVYRGDIKKPGYCKVHIAAIPAKVARATRE